MSSEAEGSRSLGLRTKVFPAAMATGNIQQGTMQGKLNGVTPATTPRGWRSVQLSIPVETWSVKSPFRSWGMPQANSTTSMPRMTSPCASENTLPCSAVMRAAISSRCSLRSATNRASTRARRIGGVSAHAGHAAAAVETARATIAASAMVTRRATFPVAGLKTSCVRALSTDTAWPPIQCPTRELSGAEKERGAVAMAKVQRSLHASVGAPPAVENHRRTITMFNNLNNRGAKPDEHP